MRSSTTWNGDVDPAAVALHLSPPRLDRLHVSAGLEQTSVGPVDADRVGAAVTFAGPTRSPDTPLWLDRSNSPGRCLRWCGSVVELPMMNEVFKKKANAKIRGAKGRGEGIAVTATMDKLMGGTWVGGEVVLTEDFLAFRANKLNRIVQKGELDAEFELGDITSAEISGGIGTKIIQVSLRNGSEFLFRCFGAKEVLASLRAALPDRT